MNLYHIPFKECIFDKIAKTYFFLMGRSMEEANDFLISQERTRNIYGA